MKDALVITCSSAEHAALSTVANASIDNRKTVLYLMAVGIMYGRHYEFIPDTVLQIVEDVLSQDFYLINVRPIPTAEYVPAAEAITVEDHNLRTLKELAFKASTTSTIYEVTGDKKFTVLKTEDGKVTSPLKNTTFETVHIWLGDRAKEVTYEQDMEILALWVAKYPNMMWQQYNSKYRTVETLDNGKPHKCGVPVDELKSHL